jgi:hypothetical protein
MLLDIPQLAKKPPPTPSVLRASIHQSPTHHACGQPEHQKHVSFSSSSTQRQATGLMTCKMFRTCLLNPERYVVLRRILNDTLCFGDSTRKMPTILDLPTLFSFFFLNTRWGQRPQWSIFIETHMAGTNYSRVPYHLLP